MSDYPAKRSAIEMDHGAGMPIVSSVSSYDSHHYGGTAAGCKGVLTSEQAVGTSLRTMEEVVGGGDTIGTRSRCRRR